MAKVTGIGGVFFKTQNSVELASWYKTHLGFNIKNGDAAFVPSTESKEATIWTAEKNDTIWFNPSHSSFMINNYRIDNMDEMIKRLKAGNVEIVNRPEYHENGAFLWIMDPAGNKLELWEPKLWDDKNKR